MERRSGCEGIGPPEAEPSASTVFWATRANDEDRPLNRQRLRPQSLSLPGEREQFSSKAMGSASAHLRPTMSDQYSLVKAGWLQNPMPAQSVSSCRTRFKGRCFAGFALEEEDNPLVAKLRSVKNAKERRECVQKIALGKAPI